MKLKPVPEKLPDQKLLYRDNAGVGIYEDDIYAQKHNEIISYLDYLREHIQQLEDMRHG